MKSYPVQMTTMFMLRDPTPGTTKELHPVFIPAISILAELLSCWWL